jgi:hypothetical protein
MGDTEPEEIINVKFDACIDEPIIDNKSDSKVVIESDNESNNESDNESDNDDYTEEEFNKSKYTIVEADNLDEDDVIPEQRYALFSFLSPEGIANCKERAFKFRGAFPTIKKAKEKLKELEEKDKYFKIFLGTQGMWLEFNPPLKRVESELTNDKDYQQIIDSQQKQRMDKINNLAGKYKETIDKNNKGGKKRINENKKMSAASDAQRRNTEKEIPGKETDKKEESTQKGNKIVKKRRQDKSEITDRMRRILAERKEKEKIKGDAEKRKFSNNIEEKTKVISQGYENIETKKNVVQDLDKNIENIKKLMEKRKSSVSTANHQ